MPRAVYGNCFLPGAIDADLVLTDERMVAEAARRRGFQVFVPEDGVEPELAHRASRDFWRLAYSWFRTDGRDPTVVEGVSAGDLAGLESAVAVLAPAARGALSMAAMLRHRTAPSTLVSLVPDRTPGGGRYERFERLVADGAVAAAQHLTGDAIEIERMSSTDPRNGALRDKYARQRDVEFLLSASRSRKWRQALLSCANVFALLRSRQNPSLLVVEYNPTLAFSQGYSALGERRRLVRWISDPREIPRAVWAGDLVQGPPMSDVRDNRCGLRTRLAPRGAALARAGFELAGVPLWSVVEADLLELIDRYEAFAARNAPRLRQQLSRWRVEGVLVPYDNSPAVRLLVRVAQSLEIPTFVLNDGYKADDIQLEGMSTDVALAWSSAIRENYFVRHPGKAIVTGNPKLGAKAPRWRGLRHRPPRVLVGGFSFSATDLNCGRSDPERFLEDVLAGVAGALPAVADEVVVKLHPADEASYYGDLLTGRPELHVRLEASGDVTALFAQSDIYLTTYSTSLLEAARMMPVIYYRVNEQRLGPPFEGDSFLGSRTASSRSELTELLRNRELLEVPPPPKWIERYLGPTDAVDRIRTAIEAEIGLSAPR